MFSLLKAIPLKLYGIGAAVALGIAIFVAINLKISALQRERDEWIAKAVAEGISRDSVIAANDTTRLIYADSVKQVWERRVVQLEDSITTFETSTTVRIDTVTIREATGTTTDSADIRLGTFDVRKIPYTAHVDVALPPPPTAGRITMSVSLDSIPMDLDVRCGEPDPLVRPVLVRASSPPWAQVTFQEVRQSPGVCNPLDDLIPTHRQRSIWDVVLPIAAGATTGLLAGDDWKDVLLGAGIGGGVVLVTWAF